MMATAGLLISSELSRRGGSGARVIQLGLVLVLGIISLLGLISATARAGRAAGYQEGYDVLARSEPVVVYSTKDIGLEDRDVSVTPVGGPNSAYRFRYIGLRFYGLGHGKYILITNRFTPQTSRVVFLLDTADIRIEFVTNPEF